VEDSGDWCVFIEGVRNAAFPNLTSPNLQTSYPNIPLYHKPHILSNQYIRFGHYTCKTMVCQVLLCMNMPLKSQRFFTKRS